MVLGQFFHTLSNLLATNIYMAIPLNHYLWGSTYFKAKLVYIIVVPRDWITLKLRPANMGWNLPNTKE